MKRLLLTGFEPFLEHPINPTAEIVEQLTGKELHQFHIIGETLSVDFSKTGAQMIQFIKKHEPDAIISLGLAAGRKEVTVERIAINCNDGPKDNRGYEPNGEKITEAGPDGYFSTLPIKAIVDQLHEKQLPASISNSAGTYLCNHVMYQSLHYIKEHQLNCPTGFIHLPANHTLALTKSMPSWSQEDLHRAVEVIIHSVSRMFS